MIPLGKPSLGAAEEAQVLEVLRSGRLTRGPKVEAFELYPDLSEADARRVATTLREVMA
jgi:dTDP-4-amino-4,6-dideoxygalactose transaminase